VGRHRPIVPQHGQTADMASRPRCTGARDVR
jgi:hypothetical protein